MRSRAHKYTRLFSAEESSTLEYIDRHNREGDELTAEVVDATNYLLQTSGPALVLKIPPTLSPILCALSKSK